MAYLVLFISILRTKIFFFLKKRVAMFSSLIGKDLEKRERRVIYVLSHNTWENLLQMTSRHTHMKRSGDRKEDIL